MTSCTRPDDFDSLIDQDQPLRISLLETIPRLQEELQAFVARVVVSAGDEVAAGEQAVTDLVSHPCAGCALHFTYTLIMILFIYSMSVWRWPAKVFQRI